MSSIPLMLSTIQLYFEYLIVISSISVMFGSIQKQISQQPNKSKCQTNQALVELEVAVQG